MFKKSWKIFALSLTVLLTACAIHNQENLVLEDASAYISTDALVVNQLTINDYANALTDEEEKRILRKILEIQTRSKEVEFAVLLVNTTDDEDIFTFTSRVFNEWDFSDAEDGVGILLAMNDRKIQILTGDSVSQRLTDKILDYTIQQKMVPMFKKQKYAEGILVGLDEMQTHLLNTKTQ